MLVLSRKRDTTIVINAHTDDEIIITVVELQGDKVRLGITARPEIPVHRGEVQDAIDRENGR